MNIQAGWDDRENVAEYYDVAYQRCGFRVVEFFGNFDRSPLADDSPEIIVVAEKV